MSPHAEAPPLIRCRAAPCGPSRQKKEYEDWVRLWGLAAYAFCVLARVLSRRDRSPLRIICVPPSPGIRFPRSFSPHARPPHARLPGTETLTPSPPPEPQTAPSLATAHPQLLRALQYRRLRPAEALRAPQAARPRRHLLHHSGAPPSTASPPSTYPVTLSARAVPTLSPPQGSYTPFLVIHAQKEIHGLWGLTCLHLLCAPLNIDMWPIARTRRMVLPGAAG